MYISIYEYAMEMRRLSRLVREAKSLRGLKSLI